MTMGVPKVWSANPETLSEGLWDQNYFHKNAKMSLSLSFYCEQTVEFFRGYMTYDTAIDYAEVVMRIQLFSMSQTLQRFAKL